MYEKDKTLRVTLRLNEKQFQFLKMNADALGVTPSEFLRMVINLTMSETEKLKNEAEAKIKETEKKRGERIEDKQADIDNQL